MAATKQLRKENEELRNDISELQQKLDKITEEMLKINDKTDQIEGGHVPKDQEKSIQFVSVQYDDLVSFKNNTNTELKYIKSQVEIISTKCEKIAKAIDQELLEDYSYQYNLKIVGIPQEQATETAEQTANLCLNLFKAIGADEVILQDIDIAHRIPARRSLQTVRTQ
jgi:predicted  nucleic acid-binding Zn-ribbon protein